MTDAFRERDALYGQQIAWTQDSRRMSGAARGIDDDGAWSCSPSGSEEVRLDAGEVHLEHPPRENALSRL